MNDKPPIPPGHIPRHPSYGYATPEQIEQLKLLGQGPDYDQLWKKIQDQTRRNGAPEK